MTKIEIAVGAIVVAGLVTFLLERHAQKGLREQNRVLEQKIEQLARLGAAGQPAVAPPDRRSPPPREQSVELLRLRGELGVRRREQAELGQLQADNQRLPAVPN